MAFPASLSGTAFWAIVICIQSYKLIDSTYNFAIDCVTGASSLLSAAKGVTLVVTGLSKPTLQTKSFPKFSQLPVELRCQIWRASFSQSRVVELRDGSGQRGKLAAQIYVVPWTSPSKPPAILHVCRESRRESLRYYELSFSRCGFPPQIYVNFENDTIYFGHRTRSEGVLDLDGHTEGFEKIQHMAIGFSGMSRFMDWQIDTLAALKDIVMVRSMTPGRYFKLGESPRLVEFEQDDSEESEFKMDVTRAVAIYVRRLRERQAGFPSWQIPLVKVGMMVKTESDGRYY